jgi:hypothetical protein
MVQSLIAKNISLYDLTQKFKLRSIPEPFTDLQDVLQILKYIGEQTK